MCWNVFVLPPLQDGTFDKQTKAVTVKDRMQHAGHLFSSTIHALVSGIKKLQRKLCGVQGTWLYRGLGGLDTRKFVEGNGYTEKGFTSTTKNLEVVAESCKSEMLSLLFADSLHKIAKML